MFVPTLLGDITVGQTVAAGVVTNSILTGISAVAAAASAVVGNLVSVIQATH